MAKKPAKGKEVVKKEETPAWMKGYEGAGQDDIGREDITMPRLKLGQAMSPEVKDDKIASEGDFIHNITKEVLAKAGDNLRFIPIAFSKEYILWYDRKGPHGGGIAARARKVVVDGQNRYMWDKPNQTFKDKINGQFEVTYKTGRFIDEDGLGDWGSKIPGDPNSQPAATEHFNYVIMLPDHDNQLIAMSLARTAAKKAREFNTMLKMGKKQHPTFGRIYKVGSFMDRSDDNTYANYQFSGYDLVQDADLGEELAQLYESLKDKGINVDFSDDDSPDVGSTGDDDKF